MRIKHQRGHRCSSILLTALFCLTICGCGSPTEIKEEILYRIGEIEEQKREKEEREIYEEERERFDQVLESAPDEELFIVLQYAIVDEIVPTFEIDPYYYIYTGVTPWFRTLRIYDKLAENREDLLQQIYPDVEALGDYVYGTQIPGEPYDTVLVNTIMQNIQQNCPSLDSLMGDIWNPTPLNRKYFRNRITSF